MKRICVATDLEPNADRAVARAIQLSKAHGASLSVVSVLDETATNKELDALRQRVTQFCTSFRDFEDIPLKVEVAAGDVVTEVHRIAHLSEADLIVLGLHRSRAILDAVRETTMERLVRTSPRPVLLVRNPCDHVYDSILAAVDFSPASEAAVLSSRKLAPEAAIAMIHAVQVPYHTAIAAPGAVGDVSTMVDPAPFVADAEKRGREWRDATPELGQLDPPEALLGAIHSVISAELAAREPDVLSLGAHSRHGAADWLLGSVASDLIRDPVCDLLVAPPVA